MATLVTPGHRVVVPPPDQRPTRLPPANALAEREAKQRRLRELGHFTPPARDRDQSPSESAAPRDEPPRRVLVDTVRAKRNGDETRPEAPGADAAPEHVQSEDVQTEPGTQAATPKPWATPDGIPPLPRPPAKPPAPAVSRGWPERVIPWRNEVEEGRCVSCGSRLESDGTCPLGHAG